MNSVGNASPSGKFWEYRYHPGIIFALKLNWYSKSDVFANEVVHLTGSWKLDAESFCISEKFWSGVVQLAGSCANNWDKQKIKMKLGK